MRIADGTVGTLFVGALAVICCAAPLLITAIGATALATWRSESAFTVIPAAIIVAGIAVISFQRRHVGVHDCCQSEKKASNHE
jgi:mercuric ion transport protein